MEFVVSQYRKLSSRYPSVFHEVSGIENVFAWRGASLISIGKLLYPSNGNFRRGTLQCFRRFRASKTLMSEREYHEFLYGICCIPVPETFVEVPFCVSWGFGHRKRLCLMSNITNYYREIVVSQYRKVSSWYPSVLQEVSGIEKVYDWRGISRISIWNLLHPSTGNFPRGTLLCFMRFRASKTFLPEEEHR